MYLKPISLHFILHNYYKIKHETNTTHVHTYSLIIFHYLQKNNTTSNPTIDTATL